MPMADLRCMRLARLARDSEDDLALRVALANMAQRVGDFAQLVTTLDDGLCLPALDEFLQKQQVILVGRQHEHPEPAAGEQRRKQPTRNPKERPDPIASAPGARNVDA